MKRFSAIALSLGLICSAGLIGCGEEAKVETTSTVETPTGTTTVTKTEKVELTGEAPPVELKPATP